MTLAHAAYSRLADVITLQRGFDLPESQRQDGDVPVVASTGVIGFHSEKRVTGPGVLIGRSGSIGGGQFISTDFWPLNTTLWVKDFKGHSPRFVYYMLRNIDFTRFNAGSGVPTLNRNHLDSVLVPAFNARQEERIADILSAYDDLVENNRRRMTLVEEAARQLYREWFVRLRFPGHENASITNGVPDGWARVHLFDIADPTYGHAFQSSLFTEDGEGLPVVRIRNVLAGESSTFTLEEAPVDRRLQNGDMLIGMDGEFHMGLWAGGDAWLNQRVVRIRSKGRIADYLLFNLLREPISTLNETITGTTVVHLGAKELKTIRILVPPHALLNRANRCFAAIGKQLVALKLLNKQLRDASELLLPRLMNGVIAV